MKIRYAPLSHWIRRLLTWISGAVFALNLLPAVAHAQACFKAPCAVPLKAAVVQPHASPVVKVVDPVQQHSSVVTTDNSIVVTNTYNFSQPASQQGNTVYGFAQIAETYGNLDLGALMVHYGRLADQTQTGAASIADQLGKLLGQAQTGQNDLARTLAVGQAAAQIAAAVRPPERATTFAIGGHGANQKPGQPGNQVGNLLSRNCAQCHAAPSQDAKALAAWDLSTGDRMEAIRAVLDGTMPKGQELDGETLTGILRELAK